MMSLLGSMGCFPPDRTILITPSGDISNASIIDKATRLRETKFADVKGGVVSLCCADTLAYIECLIALDGWASSIVLLDAATDPDLLKRFEGEVDVRYRINASATNLHVNSYVTTTGSKNTEGQTSWVIPTSGTTGIPKLISHKLASLVKSIKKPSSKSDDFRWGLLYDPTRFAGIQVILQSILGGSSLIVPRHWRDLQETVDLFQERGCNALSATPSLWRKLAISGGLKSFNFKLITLGGEAPDQKILDWLSHTYPDALLRHIYASTEAGVGFSVTDGKIGFPATFLDTHPKGVELRIKKDGMLMLRPSMLEQKLISKHLSLEDSEGWIESGDLVVKKGDRFEFLGRLNGAINVGGQKVHPAYIESVIIEVEGVAAVRAYGQASSILGNLVVVEIESVPSVDPIELKKSVKSICLSKLSRFQRPAMIEIVDQITLTDTGKINR